MPICAGSTEAVDRPGQDPYPTSRITVTITAWDYQYHGGDRAVVLDLLDEAGQPRSLRFGLSWLELSTGRLDRFIRTVLQREFSLPKGMQPQFHRHMLLNATVGRRVVLLLVETGRGAQVVVDWESAPRE